MTTELFKAFGPWAIYIVATGLLLKYLVSDKLKAIMKKLDMVDRHESELVEIRTVLRLNGLMDALPTAHRRGGEA